MSNTYATISRHTLRYLAILVLGAGAVMTLVVGGASASNIHFVGTPTCTKLASGDVECSGKLAGLGKAPTTVEVVVPVTCTNAGTNPPGQQRGSSGPITPSGGQITFDVTTTTNSCHGNMVATVGSTATINVYQGGKTPIFTADVPIT
ncbi:MAG: hypothetical protein M3P30_03520 [Chloroflexota bacterium]|nr:hypothetical protein [Chloroflexota bacterium]